MADEPDVIKGVRMRPGKTLVIEGPEGDHMVTVTLNANADLVFSFTHNPPVRIASEIYLDGVGGAYPQVTAEY